MSVTKDGSCSEVLHYFPVPLETSVRVTTQHLQENLRILCKITGHISRSSPVRFYKSVGSETSREMRTHLRIPLRVSGDDRLSTERQRWSHRKDTTYWTFKSLSRISWDIVRIVPVSSKDDVDRPPETSWRTWERDEGGLRDLSIILIIVKGWYTDRDLEVGIVHTHPHTMCVPMGDRGFEVLSTHRTV